MILSGHITRLSFQGAIMLLLCLDTIGQGRAKNFKTDNDTSATGSELSHHSLFAGTGYGSNMIWLGSTISKNQPYSYGALTYGFSTEFYASFSSVHLTDVNPFLSFHIGSLNWDHVFNSWFDISAGLYRYQVAPSLTTTLFSNFTYTDMTLGFDWRLLYSKISAGALFSNENQAYFQFRNSRYFKTPEFFNDKVNISFDPYINMLFGTLIKTNTSSETSFIITTPSRKWGRYHTITTTSTSYSKKIGLMEVDFGLPVAVNTDILTIEAEASYLLPVHDDPDFPGSRGFIFMLSGFFRIF